MEFLTDNLGTIVTIIIAMCATYAAISSRLTKVETLIESLRSDVEKHNTIIERTYKLESDVKTAFKRIDELRDADRRIEDRLNEMKEAS